MSGAFLLAAFIVVASPGTGAIFTLAAGLSGGTRAAIVAAFGCTLGIVPHMIAAISGIAALFHASDLAFAALRSAGVAYLLFMAWSTWRAGLLGVEGVGTSLSDWQVVRRAVLVNLLNPKLSIFFLAFLPQFVAVDEPEPTAQMLMLSLVFMALTFGVFALYGVFASALRRQVLASAKTQRGLRRGFAAAFALLALQLALSDR